MLPTTAASQEDRGVSGRHILSGPRRRASLYTWVEPGFMGSEKIAYSIWDGEKVGEALFKEKLYKVRYKSIKGFLHVRS